MGWDIDQVTAAAVSTVFVDCAMLWEGKGMVALLMLSLTLLLNFKCPHNSYAKDLDDRL